MAAAVSCLDVQVDFIQLPRRNSGLMVPHVAKNCEMPTAFYLKVSLLSENKRDLQGAKTIKMKEANIMPTPGPGCSLSRLRGALMTQSTSFACSPCQLWLHPGQVP